MANASKEDKAEGILIRYQNRKAAGILLGSIKTDTNKEKAAFYLVEKFIDADAGYAGGNFPSAWSALTKRYEDVDTVSKADLKQKYHDLKMGKDDQPSLFIVKLERLRVKLKKDGEVS